MPSDQSEQGLLTMINRRQLLQRTATGLGLLAALQLTSGCVTRRPSVSMQGDTAILNRFVSSEDRTAIIGGGISGLVTAFEILKARPPGRLLRRESGTPSTKRSSVDPSLGETKHVCLKLSRIDLLSRSKLRSMESNCFFLPLRGNALIALTGVTVGALII